MGDAAATIIIPNFNGLAFLPRLLDSLADQSRRDFEICVVDDCSTDESRNWLQSRSDVRLILNEQNLGFAGTCNAGLRTAQTPFVCLLNNDTHLDRRWFEAALKPFDDPAIAAVQSLVLLAEPPHLIDSAGDLYTTAGGALKRLHGRPREAAAKVLLDCFSCCGASAFFRKSALDFVGPLNESFVSYYEDVELGFRLHLAGYRCVLAPDSICYHHLNASYKPESWAMHFNSARNAEIVWWAHMPDRLRWKHILDHLAFLTLQFGAEILHRRTRAFLSGKLAAWRSRDRIRAIRAADKALTRVPDEQIESILRADWWNLLVRPRLIKLWNEVRGRC